MEKILEQVKEWPYLKTLPAEAAGFRLTAEPVIDAVQCQLFSYDNPGTRRRFAVMYDKTTKDYLARVTVGMTEFVDVNFITTDLAALEAALKSRMDRALRELAGQGEYESIFREKKIAEWGAALPLPESLHGFSLFIRPDKALKSINGSYLILDYSDFASSSGLNLYYNVYRDEFFAELRFMQTPEMISCLDAEELSVLGNLLSEQLDPLLAQLRSRINEANQGRQGGGSC